MLRLWQSTLLAGLLLLAFPSLLGATPLNPNDFPSLGTLNLSQNAEILTFDPWYLPDDNEATIRVVPYSPDLDPPDYIGVVDPITNTAVFTFDSITIPAGVWVDVRGTRPVVLLSRGAVTIGGYLGIGNGPTSGPGVGIEGGDYGGGGGGGFGGRGGNGSLNGINPSYGLGGVAYGNLAVTLVGGSPGGDGGDELFSMGGDGGIGGGVLEIGALGDIVINGQMDAFGEGGGESTGPGGGGGSGGAVLLHSLTSITLGSSALLNVRGGAGGAGNYEDFLGNDNGGGGGGGGGRVYLQAPSVVNQGIVDLSGGVGGIGSVNGQSGGPGDPGVLTISLVPEPTSLVLLGFALACGLIWRVVWHGQHRQPYSAKFDGVASGRPRPRGT